MSLNYLTFDQNSSHPSDLALGRNPEPPTQIRLESEQSGSELASTEVVNLSETSGNDFDVPENPENSSTAASKAVGKMAGEEIRQPSEKPDHSQSRPVRKQPWAATGFHLLEIGCGVALLCLNAATLKNNSAWVTAVSQCQGWDLGCNDQDKIWFQENGFTSPLSVSGPVISDCFGGWLIIDGVSDLFKQAWKAMRTSGPD